MTEDKNTNNNLIKEIEHYGEQSAAFRQSSEQFKISCAKWIIYSPWWDRIKEELERVNG